MRGFKTLLCTTALLAPLALVPPVDAQISINIGPQPVCSYGYYEYSPYACAPAGYYGPGYFYNGIFLGMGPWAGWGYNHGWGRHRFSNGGGGSYSGGFHGYADNRGRNGRPEAVRTDNRGGSSARPSPYGAPSRGNAPYRTSHTNTVRGGTSHGASHPAAAHVGSPHTTAARGNSSHGTSHAAAAHGSESHGGGSHDGGGHQ